MNSNLNELYTKIIELDVISNFVGDNYLFEI